MIELGNEGAILKTRFKEVTSGVEKETNLTIKDYTKLNLKNSKILLESLSYDEILDKENIFKVLGYTEQKKAGQIKGWRILSKTLLHEEEIAKIINVSPTAIGSDAILPLTSKAKSIFDAGTTVPVTLTSCTIS